MLKDWSYESNSDPLQSESNVGKIMFITTTFTTTTTILFQFPFSVTTILTFGKLPKRL